jgi:hypothetical protein
MTDPAEFAMTPGQERFIFKLSRMIPESFWITQLTPELRVGTVREVMDKKGVIRMIFLDHRTLRPEDVGFVIAWDDGSVTISEAILNFME